MLITNVKMNQSRWLFHGLFLALFWAISFGCLWHITSKGALRIDNSSHESPARGYSSATDFGAFTGVYFNPEQNHRPEYALSFDTLSLSNRSLGLLKTSLYKTVYVENLKYLLFSYAEESVRESEDNDELTSLVQEEALSFSDQLRRLHSSSEGLRIGIPDLSKTAQIDIREFLFKWHRESDGELIVRSRRAVFAAESPGEVQLLGRVTLSRPGRQFEASRVTWNFEKRRFEISGRTYVPTLEGKRIEQNILLDYDLNILDEDSIPLHTKGDSLCLANEYPGD